MSIDDVFPDVLAIVAAAHVDDKDYLVHLAIDLHVTTADDVVGQELDGIVAELQGDEIVLDLHRFQDGDAGRGHCADHPVEWPNRHFAPVAARDHCKYAVPPSAGEGAMVTDAGGWSPITNAVSLYYSGCAIVR